MGSRERETTLDPSPAALSLACFFLCTTGIAKPSAFSAGPRPVSVKTCWVVEEGTYRPSR